jgi:hypothetical protein
MQMLARHVEEANRADSPLENPGVNPLRDGSGGDSQLAQLVWLQTPGLAEGDAGTVGHPVRVSNVCSGLQRDPDGRG